MKQKNITYSECKNKLEHYKLSAWSGLISTLLMLGALYSSPHILLLQVALILIVCSFFSLMVCEFLHYHHMMHVLLYTRLVANYLYDKKVHSPYTKINHILIRIINNLDRIQTNHD